MTEREIIIPITIRDYLENELEAISNHKVTFQLQKVSVRILEMEDVLFHLNSAIMMPENPEGPSAKTGKPDSEQIKVTGVRALALAFKQLQLHPQQKLLVAGHADRSGTAKYNFELSTLRAQNVMHILEGNKIPWAEICVQKHKVEDYQQILSYYSVSLGWDCDPGKIDNTWGQKTEKATRNFITLYNLIYVYKLDPKTDIDESIVDTIKNDPDHLWLQPLWEAVFDLYQHDLIQAVTGKHLADASFNKIRNGITPMDPQHPLVGCSESFPISQNVKKNYRSQKDRRVEIMFFDINESIPLSCPQRTDSVHTKEECILQNDKLFKTEYIEPEEYFTALYHLKFLYYDAIYQDFKPLPKGLPIRVYKDKTTEIQTLLKYGNDIYEISALGLTHTPREKDIHFRYQISPSWIYTKDNSSPPEIMNESEIAEMLKPKKFAELTLAEKQHFTPLATIWDSRNWPCEFEENEDEFEKQVMLETSASKPLIFNMDTMVLLENEGGTQEIHDADHFDKSRELELGKSRVKILQIDPADASLSLYQTDTDAITSRLAFARNCISEKIKNVAAVFFRNGFYLFSSQHTQVENQWLEKNYLIGARSMVLVDNNRKVSWEMFHNENEHAYTGDYDVHYLHHVSLFNLHPISYSIIYVSINFMRDSGAGPNPIPSQADVDKFVNEGIYNAMERFNQKKYFFEELTSGDNTTIIKPFFFFDERETFIIPDADQPSGINFDDDAQASTLMTHASVRDARKAAFGGKPKFLALIITDSNPAANDGDAYQWPIRDNSGNYDFSIFQLHQSAYKAETNGLPGVPATEYGQTHGGFTFAHELGHATSLADEYINTNAFIPNQSNFPEFDQFFEQYTMEENTESLMYHMGPLRLHHLWYHVHLLNNQISSGSLSSLLTGKIFRVKYEHGSGSFLYHRPLSGFNAFTRDIRTPDCHEAQHELVNSGALLKRLYLALYYVGQDESSVGNFHPGQGTLEYHGVLCVRSMLNFDFAGAWTDVEKDLKMNDFRDMWHFNNDTFRLVNGSAPIEDIYIHFLVGYTVPGESNVGDSNYTLNFVKDETITSGAVSTTPDLSTLVPDLAVRTGYDFITNSLTYEGWMTDAHHTSLQGLFTSMADKAVVTDMRDRSHSVNRITNVNGTLTVRNDVTMDELAHYILNMEIGDDYLTSLAFLKTWVDNQTGNTYTLEYI